MRTFKELCDGKVWRAVEAMITGLETQSQRPDFRVNMATFGTIAREDHYGDFSTGALFSGDTVCFGCAATCAVQQLTGINYTIDSAVEKIAERALFLNIDFTDLNQFENAIDDLRQRNITPLEYYMYGAATEKLYFVVSKFLPALMSNNWRENLPKYKVLLRYLKYRDI